MFTELLAALAAGLAALHPVAAAFRKFAEEVEKTLSTLGRISDNVRIRRELQLIKELSLQVAFLCSGKGDISDWIEWYASKGQHDPDAWGQLVPEFERLSQHLERIQERLVTEPFTESALAAEMAELARKASAAFAQMSELPAPKDEREIGMLREVGAAVRQIQHAGHAALGKVDAYAERLGIRGD